MEAATEVAAAGDALAFFSLGAATTGAGAGAGVGAGAGASDFFATFLTAAGLAEELIVLVPVILFCMFKRTGLHIRVQFGSIFWRGWAQKYCFSGAFCFFY
jgi:hypothetical protein